MTTLPTGMVTFLFTDIEGSTQLWEKHPEEMKLALARHDAILRQAIESHDGYVFKTVGDAFCAAFADAPDALSAALDAQRSLLAESWGETLIRVRMGLHTGTAEVRDQDYFGQTLNRVARLMSAGHGGQTLLSASTANLVQENLLPGAELRDMGERRLKDLTRPEHIYQLSAPDLPAAFPPLKALDTFRTNLPTQLTSFVGREKEIAAVKSLMTTQHLTTLTGPGGTGKTRLSLQVAIDLLDSFPEGVWFVELAPLTDPALIPQTVLITLGLHEDGSRVPLEILTDYLQQKKALLILDNCEHLIEASAQLCTTLLQACQDLRILVSSREALGIPGESAYRVPSLSIPNPRQHPSAEALTQSESARLFIDRAQAVLSSFAVTDVNAPIIAQICARLDGIPLAIELAAARIKMLRVEQIAERLDDRFRLLTGGSRTALPRQQTLRALIDWSYDLLSEPERTLLMRLSVFSGGWTLEAAEAVCTAKSEIRSMKDEENPNSLHTSEFILHPSITLHPFDILDLLTQLLNKSLIVVEFEEETRYRQLETIRQYAREKLFEAGQGEQIRDQHLDYFLKLAERSQSELGGPQQTAWLSRLDAELDNLHSALDWALETNVQAGLRLANALEGFWRIQSYFRDGCLWLSQLLAQPQTLDYPSHRAKALSIQSILATELGGLSQARAFAKESLEIYRGLSDQPGIARSLIILGRATCLQSDFDLGRSLLEEGIAIYRALGDKAGLARGLRNLGLYSNSKDLTDAKRYSEESLALFRTLGDVRSIGFLLGDLGLLATQERNYTLAHTYLEESLAILRPFGGKITTQTLLWMGDLSFREGNYKAARDYYEEPATYFKESGQTIWSSWLQVRLGFVALRLGEISTAYTLFSETLQQFNQEGIQDGVAYTLEGLASLAVTQKQMQRATQIFAWTDATRETINNPRPDIEQIDVDHDLTTIRSQISDATFAAAQAAGRAMSIDEAVAYALEVEATHD